MVLIITSFAFTGGNVLCLDLWGRQGGASLQSLHFSFAVGAFIAPLVIHPFFVGMHPAEIHNQTLVTTEATTQVSEVQRYVREVERALNDSFNLTSLSSEEIRALTLPADNTSIDQEPLSNLSTLDVALPTSDEVNTEAVALLGSTTISNANLTSNATQKPAGPKRKPTFTDGTKLGPESAEWVKKPQKEDAQPNAGSDKPAEKSKGNSSESSSAVPTTTVTVSDDVQATETPLTTDSSPINESVSGDPPPLSTTPKSVSSVPPQASEEVLPQHSSSVAPDKSPTVDNHATEPSTFHAAATTVPATTTTAATTTTTTTSTTTTTTTTATTTSSTTTTTTTTTTTPKPPVVIDKSLSKTPHPRLLVADGMRPTKAEDDMSHGESNTGYDGDHVKESQNEGTKEKISEKDTFVGDSRLNNSTDSIPEPKVLDSKESPTYDPSETGNTDLPDNSGIQSIIQNFKPGTYSNGSDENSQFLDNMAQRFKDYGVTKVHLAYICIGIFIILNALISVVILCHNPREPRSKQEDGSSHEFHKGKMALFVIIFSLFMFMAEALQGAVHHLLATSSISASTTTGIDVIKDSGLDGQALFWGLVCLVRFLCILMSGCLRLKPGKLLIMALLFSLIGSVFMAIGSFGKEDFLWGGIIFMALGLAPILPTSLLWMAQYMRVTHRMCALMIVLASFGNTLTHLALTHVVGRPHLYAYILIFISGNSLLFLLFSMCALYTTQRSKTLGVPIGYQLASQHEEEDSIELTPSGSAVFTPSDPRIRENGEAGQSLLID